MFTANNKIIVGVTNNQAIARSERPFVWLEKFFT
jgi:hypothetical protein